VTISALAPHHRRGAACLAGWLPAIGKALSVELALVFSK